MIWWRVNAGEKATTVQHVKQRQGKKQKNTCENVQIRQITSRPMFQLLLLALKSQQISSVLGFSSEQFRQDLRSNLICFSFLKKKLGSLWVSMANDMNHHGYAAYATRY